MANIFSNTCRISERASVDISSRGTDTIIGENSVVDDFVRIKHVGGSGHVIIGDNCYINSGTVIYSGNGVRLGNDVLVGPNCSLVPANHAFHELNTPIRLQGFAESKGGIVIENNVWIGAGVTVLDGAYIEEGCIIGANSLVMGRLLKDTIYGGVPAEILKKRAL